MPSTGLAYGHVASNIGDLAINEGFSELCALAGIERPTVVLTRMARPKYKARMREQLAGAVLHETSTPPAKELPETRIKDLLLLAEAIMDPIGWGQRAGLSKVDVVVSNSGEHLFDTPDGVNSIDLLWRVVPLIASSMLGKPGIQLPATMGPFSTRHGTLALKALLETASSWAVRDASSQAYLTRGHDVQARQVLLDPAFFLPHIPRPEPDTQRIAIIPRLENFGLRAGKAASRTSSARARKEEFRTTQAYGWSTAVAREYLRRGWQVDLYVQTEADRHLVDAIAKALRTEHTERQNMIHVLAPSSVTEYRHWLSRSSLLVSSRFHACILGLALGVPSVGLHHESHWLKLPGLYSVLEHPQQAVKLSEDGDAEFPQVFEALEAAPGAQSGIEELIRDKRSATVAWFREGALHARAPREHNELRAELLEAVRDLMMEEFQAVNDAWTARTESLINQLVRE